MAKIILLGNSGVERIGSKIQKWIWILIGTLFLIQGGLYYYKDSDVLIDRLMAKLMLFGGILALIYAWASFSKKSLFAPKLIFSDSTNALKGGLFKKSKKVKWADMQSITFKPFRIDLKTDKLL